MTEDEMVGWHQQVDGHEFEQALGVSNGQGILACCCPWGCKELATNELLNLIGLITGISDTVGAESSQYRRGKENLNWHF